MDAIVDVAVRVFLQRGYDGASLDQVAEAAGITKASIYYHAEGKEALLARGAGRALDALFAVLEEAAATEGREIDRLKYVLKRTIEITVQRLPEVALLLRVRGNTQTLNALDSRTPAPPVRSPRRENRQPSASQRSDSRRYRGGPDHAPAVWDAQLDHRMVSARRWLER